MMAENYLKHSDRLEAFQLLMKQIQEFNWKHALQKGCRIYNVNCFNIKKTTPDKIKDLYYRINEKFYLTQRFKNNMWLENQLRVFVWILIITSELKNTLPENFIEDDWKIFTKIFEGKTIQICKFQYKSIINKKVSPWNQEQDKLLASLIQGKQSKSNWNAISREFFKISDEKYFKTSKQCREHWNNYLNPRILKSTWTQREDYLLMKHVVEKGKQWATISKILDARRTEHMVKNRFKSIVLLYSKQFNMSKKLAESYPVLQRIYQKMQCQFGENQQQIPNQIKQEYEKLKQPVNETTQFKHQPQFIMATTPNESTTIGINSPNIISPFAFAFSPNQSVFQSFLVPLQIYNLQPSDSHCNLFSFPAPQMQWM